MNGGVADLYAAEGGRMRRLLRRLTGSAEAAEDVLHDAVVKLSDRAIGPGDVGLVIRTAQNLARDARRAERVRAAYSQSITREQAMSDQSSPDDIVSGRQEIDDLLNALQTLPPRTRRVFLMSRVDELTYPQIARELGISVSTVEKDMISALDFCRTWRRRRE